MTDQAPAIFVALEASSFAAAIRQSLWLYPAANVGHIIALVFFAGSVAVMDVRLLGGLAATAPSHVALNPVFQLKLALIGAGLVNVGLYEFGAKREVEGLPPGATMPAHARIVGAVSLLLWVAVAACGRSIAYF